MIDSIGEISLETRGPRGGRVRPEMVERKRAHANVTMLPSGDFSLHRIEGIPSHQTAATGWKNEQPWHRMAAYMLASGKGESEVAAAAGVRRETISQLKAQVWFQEILATLASQVGRSVIDRMVNESHACLDKMIALRDDESFDEKGRPIVPASVKHAICRDIIEQVHGKAVQKVISVTASTSFDSERDERDALEKELQTIRAARRKRQNGAAGDDEVGPCPSAAEPDTQETKPQNT